MPSFKIRINNRFLSDTKNNLIKLCEKILKSDEFEASKLTQENNICHDHEAVYSHTLRVFNRFQELLRLDFIGEENLEEVRSYFSRKIGKFTRAELFLVSALLHDLGKNETLVANNEGVTKAPEHEHKSVGIAKRILKDVNLRNDEVTYLVNLIKLHSGYALRFLGHIEE